MRQPYMEINLNGMSMRGLGNKIPSPLVALSLTNAESGLQTNFSATLHIHGNANNSVHVGSFEMMLYEFAQMKGDSVIPCYIQIGWADSDSNALDVISIQGIFMQFKSSVKGSYIEYVLTGLGNFSETGNIKGLALPAIRGNYRPSDVLEACLNYVQADGLFDYDIDHDDEVVPINMSSRVTSISTLVYGDGNHQGLIQQSYCEGTRSAAYRLPGNLCSEDYRNAGYTNSRIQSMLGEPVCSTQRSASSYTFSITDPTFHSKGLISYKNDSNLANYVNPEVLMYGGLETNILSITATYNGITQQLLGSGSPVQTGLALGLDGSVISSGNNRQNSYASSAQSMYATGNVLNNLNAISTQFNTDIQVTIVGQPTIYKIAQAVRLIVWTRGTLNPITGVYRVMKVTHNVTGTSYTTLLALKRLDPITANSAAGNKVGDGSSSPTVNSSSTGGLQPTGNLNFGPPYQNISNLMRRGNL